MYIFLSNTQDKFRSNITPVKYSLSDALKSDNGLCHIITDEAAQSENIRRFLQDLKSHFPHRSMHIVFQPRPQYITEHNRVEYCKSFAGADSILVTESFGKDKQIVPRIRDIMMGMKHYSKIKRAKRAFNYRDIISYIKNDLPPNNLVIFVGFKNILSITKDLSV